VGRLVNLYITTYKRKTVGPKYKGVYLFMKMLVHTVQPERVDNFYRCAKISDTNPTFVRVADLCTLLAEVPDRSGDPTMVNLLPLAHAFPVSWIAE
jgi:hypothetical protein